jgi:cytochrome c peroxidase
VVKGGALTPRPHSAAAAIVITVGYSMTRQTTNHRRKSFFRLGVVVLVSLVALLWASLTQAHAVSNTMSLSKLEQFGKAIFHDQMLSVNNNMSCATCHAISAGGTASSDISNRKLGLHPGSKFESYDQPPSESNTFAFRNIQTNAYSVYSPPMHRELAKDGSVILVGGNFWDGRALGFITGRPTQEQAMVPPLGTLEGELPAAACVVKALVDHPPELQTGARYQDLFGHRIDEIQWPDSIDADCKNTNAIIDLPTADDQIAVQRAYSNVAVALWAYQRSSEVIPFSSKFDASLEGHAVLSASEKRGLKLFEGKAKCASCHVATASPGQAKPLFTDFTYDNIGIPRNPANPVYTFTMINPEGRNWVDKGLGAVLRQDDTLREQANANIGKFKVPTLRNVDRRPDPEFVRAYMHNGYFRSLEQVVDFYNTRDVKPRCSDRFTDVETAERDGCWPEPEIADNMNTAELGDLGLDKQETSDLVSFLKTLSDG